MRYMVLKVHLCLRIAVCKSKAYPSAGCSTFSITIHAHAHAQVSGSLNSTRVDLRREGHAHSECRANTAQLEARLRDFDSVRDELERCTEETRHIAGAAAACRCVCHHEQAWMHKPLPAGVYVNMHKHG